MLVSRPDQGRQATTPLAVAGTGFRPNLYDAVIFVLVIGVFVLIAHGFREMSGPAIRLSTEPVTLDVARLPEYALRTTLRMFAAIICSLVFTFVVATLAARSRKAELVILPTLDILQSVPVLGFLTFTVTFFLQLFPAACWAPNVRRSSPFSPARPGTWPSASTSRCAPCRATSTRWPGTIASRRGCGSGGSTCRSLRPVSSGTR